MKRLCICILVSSMFTVSIAATWIPSASQPQRFAHRWVYVMMNLQVNENVGKMQELMKRAKAAGYNGIVLADYKLNILDRVPEWYFKNAAEVKKSADELGIEIIPAVCSIGYSNGLLAHDPNLAEGMPVKDALFVAGVGQAQLAPDPAVVLTGGDFEVSNADKAIGWDYQDDPGQKSFIDRETKHGGAASLRMERVGGANGRVQQLVNVSPWRQYHVSAWVKTQDFESASDVRCVALTEGGLSLAHQNWNVKRTQDWTEVHTVFNSLGNKQVRVYLGVWGGRGGKLWFDDAKIEEVGLMNLLRRPGCPLVVKGEDGTVYQEGRDFEPAKDPRMGTVPWEGGYEVYHASPPIKLTANSRIRDRQHLRVSFHHSISIYDGQVNICTSEPKTYEILADQVKRVNQVFKPKTWFLSHDEIRVGNWCDACQAKKQTPGQQLADNVRRCAALIRAASPSAKLVIWSDMFDPSHNAVEKDYYLVNGSYAGSWEGVPPDVEVANWNSGKAKESLAFFGKRGNPQVLAGYYDGPASAIKNWLAQAGNAKISGVMYTTWVGNYGDLEAFAKAAWGGG